MLIFLSVRPNPETFQPAPEYLSKCLSDRDIRAPLRDAVMDLRSQDLCSWTSALMDLVASSIVTRR